MPFLVFLIIAVLLGIGVWGIAAVVRRLKHRQAEKRWRWAFTLLFVAGLLVGCWLSFSFVYQVSPNTRFHSFPIPLVIFHLEDGRWVDFVTPTYIMIPGLAANILTVTAAMLSPLLFVPIRSSTPRK